MEQVSVELSREYLRTCGRILHHNIDKAFLVAGSAEVRLGGGVVTEPMRLIFGDRATAECDGQRVAVEEIAVRTAKAWIRDNLRFVDPERHVVYDVQIKPGSPELVDIFQRERPVANDTSAAVGFAPLSPTERVVLDVERLLNGREFKREFPEVGEDVKVMGYRRGDALHLTAAVAFVDRFIYSEQGKKMGLSEYLPWKRTKRRRKRGRKVHRSRIPNRVSIRERPIEATSRAEFGHWEGDTVEGKGHKDGIHTEVERVSRLLLAVKVNQVSSEQAIEAQKAMFAPLPAEARKSTTLDNGRENHRHAELAELGMATYFADPYSSWQRGTNEYHNGLLRRYLPKGSSFQDLDDDELADIVWEINNRPRKVLNFNTPQEVYNHCLGVRIQL